MKKYLCLILFFITLASSIASSMPKLNGDFLFKRISSSKLSDSQLSKAVIADSIGIWQISKANADKVFAIGLEKFELSGFPINPLQSADVILEKASSAVDAKTEWYRQTSDGLIKAQGPSVACYKGKIKNYVNSEVFVTYSSGMIFAHVKSIDGLNYDITSVPELDIVGNPKVIVTEQNLKSRMIPGTIPFTGLEKDIHFNSTEYFDNKNNTNKPLAQKNGLLECKIVVDAVYSYFKLMDHDFNRASSYIAAVMSHVSWLYEEFINVRISVPYVVVRESEEKDPYINDFAAYDFDSKLDAMPQIWKTIRSKEKDIALVCMFTDLNDTQASGSMTAGLSFGGYPGTGSLCDIKKGYSIFGINGNYTYPNYNYTWDVSVAAHEIGHNFGSPHTHSCYYAPDMIDTCVTKTQPVPVGDACTSGPAYPAAGTIMSYCHLSNATHSVELKFHPREIPNMRAAAEKAYCVTKITYPIIDILSPLKETSYKYGDVINIRWTSAKVNFVNIFYSTDNGKNWINIKSDIPATDSVYKWNAPKISTTNMTFKVQDNSIDTVFDISNSKITIISPSITLIYPSANIEFGQKEIMTIAWESIISKNFKCFFSSDNGNNWNPISEQLTTNYFNYDIPDIISENCFVKVIDTDDNSVISISPKYSIGISTLKITSPADDEIICSGYNYKIRWNSRFVNTIQLFYSIDAGATWKKLSLAAVKTNPSEYLWKIPASKTDSAKIKVLLKDDNDIVLFETEKYFKIDTCIPSSSLEQIEANKPFSVQSISPNPAHDKVNVNINLFDNNSIIKYDIYDELGKLIIASKEINGINSIISFDNFAQGKYFIKFYSDNYIETYSITILK